MRAWRARRRRMRPACVARGARVRADAMRPLRWQVAVVAAAGLAPPALETLPTVLRWLWVRHSARPRPRVLFFPSQVTCTEALLRSPGATPSRAARVACPRRELTGLAACWAPCWPPATVWALPVRLLQPAAGPRRAAAAPARVRVRRSHRLDYMALAARRLVCSARQVGRALGHERWAGLRGAWGSVGLGGDTRVPWQPSGVYRGASVQGLSPKPGRRRRTRLKQVLKSKAFQGPRSLCRAQVCRDAAVAWDQTEGGEKWHLLNSLVNLLWGHLK